MRKLHKKYIVLNVFLIIYIMSLSVGYAYFSESIQATGTAKTLEYSNMPFIFVFSEDANSLNKYTFAGTSGYQDYITYTKTLHPSYDTYEVYHTIDYSMALEDESIFPDSQNGTHALSFYLFKTVDIPITNYVITAQDLTNIVYKFIPIKTPGTYNLTEYDTVQSWKDYTYYARDSVYIQLNTNGDFGALSPNPKKILVNVAFTSQGVNRNLKIYFIFNMI